MIVNPKKGNSNLFPNTIIDRSAKYLEMKWRTQNGIKKFGSGKFFSFSPVSFVNIGFKIKPRPVGLSSVMLKIWPLAASSVSNLCKACFFLNSNSHVCIFLSFLCIVCSIISFKAKKSVKFLVCRLLRYWITAMNLNQFIYLSTEIFWRIFFYLDVSLNNIFDVNEVDEKIFFLWEFFSGDFATNQVNGSA